MRKRRDKGKKKRRPENSSGTPCFSLALWHQTHYSSNPVRHEGSVTNRGFWGTHNPHVGEPEKVLPLLCKWRRNGNHLFFFKLGYKQVGNSLATPSQTGYVIRREMNWEMEHVTWMFADYFLSTNVISYNHHVFPLSDFLAQGGNLHVDSPCHWLSVRPHSFGMVLLNRWARNHPARKTVCASC
jgi:hypothetical protein